MRRCHLNKDVKEVREKPWWYQGKDGPSQENSKCKGSEAGPCLVCLGNMEKAIAKTEGTREKWEGDRWGQGWDRTACAVLTCHGEDTDFWSDGSGSHGGFWSQDRQDQTQVFTGAPWLLWGQNRLGVSRMGDQGRWVETEEMGRN